MEKPSNVRILEILRGESSGYVSGEAICELLGMTRSAIWKHVETLRALGYTIEAFPHRGYRLVSSPDKLLAEELSCGLETELVGKQILSHDTLDSTNETAYALAQKGKGEGTVVASEGQTRGKGRLGRSWASPKGKGIYLSVILKPALPPQSVPKLTLFASLAASRAIQKTTDVSVQMRWPNDLLLNGKKVAGILTEMNAEQDRVYFVIVGIGINVNASPELLPEGATSLKIETGKNHSRVVLARNLLQELDRLYRDFREGQSGGALEECRRLSSVLGTHVTIEEARGRKEGYALDIDEEGALLLRHDDGLTERILSGDLVRLR